MICTSRNPENLSGLPGIEAVRLDVSAPFSLDFIPSGSLVLHSIPPLDQDDPNAIVAALGDRPRRVVYLSTTGVYGASPVVDSSTPVAPRHERDWQRVRAESAVLGGPFSSMVLRPAAIYGPDRGIHISMLQGRFRLVNGGSNYVSRIHVDDLAAHAEAALLSTEEGAWPVADDYPCTSLEIAKYCAELFGIELPESASSESVHHTRRADRRVDGRAVRQVLRVTLRYPSFHVGIPPDARLP